VAHLLSPPTHRGEGARGDRFLASGPITDPSFPVLPGMRRILAVSNMACHALHIIHDHGVVHNDCKGGNVVVKVDAANNPIGVKVRAPPGRSQPVGQILGPYKISRL
jgi:hypothetical protein